jgi:hypothetical protein
MSIEKLQQERQWLQHRLFDIQRSSGLEALKEALEIKQYLEEINTQINELNYNTSNQKK